MNQFLSQSLLLCSIAVVGLAGCTKENHNLRNVLPPCTVQSDCSDDQICTNEGCAPRGCRGDYDCQTGWRCYRAADTSYCAPDDGTPPVPVDPGSGTGSGTGSGSGSGSGGGTGTGSGSGAGIVCSADSPCASGQSCVGGRCYNDAQATCGVLGLSQCSSDAACGGGKKCVGGQCLSTCSTSCGSGSTCSSGVCVPKAGSQCIFDSECGSLSRCINGSCLLMCNTDSQCPSSDRCLRGTCRSK